MQTVGIFEAKHNFSILLDRVSKGEQVLITKHGRPVAKLVPAALQDPERIQNAIKRLQSFKKKNTLDGLDWKMLRDEGRK
ncbi:MAG: prevent-host-death protein [Gammaproteobacteria bacterium GWF2_41_13]|nr:MAG: prevent-host-death protein [Gammaproteobacteria bacterium GWF2_41_13]